MDKERLGWIISGISWENLTDWEERFIEDMEAKFKRFGDLTEKQEEVLERIFREKAR
jgi:hypothetical protein